MSQNAPANAASPNTGGSAGPRISLWQGRAAVLIGIVLMGISLRYAVTGLSPLLSDLRNALGIGPAWLMTLIAGLAGGAFPLAIAMFNLRSRTTMGSAAIGGFAMGIGYLAGTLGPLLGGWLYATTGSWAMALWVYAATLIPMAIGGMMMAKPDRYLEDTLKS